MSANSEYLAVVARGREVEVTGSAESLQYLVDLLQSLRERKVVLDHEHLIAPSWGGSDLAEISESANQHSFPMVTLRRVGAGLPKHISLSTEKQGLELVIEADDQGLLEMEAAIRELLSGQQSAEGQGRLIWEESASHMIDERLPTALTIKLLPKGQTGV